MQMGVVRSYKETFFSFKGNSIIIKLASPVFQIVMQEKGLTCISKQIELHLSQDLTDVEAKVMGRTVKLRELENSFINMKSDVWISTTMDSGDLTEKLNGVAKTCDGKVLFKLNYEVLSQGFEDICRYADQDIEGCKKIIKQYCEKNIEMITDQIRRLTGDKNLYSELAASL